MAIAGGLGGLPFGNVIVPQVHPLRPALHPAVPLALPSRHLLRIGELSAVAEGVLQRGDHHDRNRLVLTLEAFDVFLRDVLAIFNLLVAFGRFAGFGVVNDQEIRPVVVDVEPTERSVEPRERHFYPAVGRPLPAKRLQVIVGVARHPGKSQEVSRRPVDHGQVAVNVLPPSPLRCALQFADRCADLGEVLIEQFVLAPLVAVILVDPAGQLGRCADRHDEPDQFASRQVDVHALDDGRLPPAARGRDRFLPASDRAVMDRFDDARVNAAERLAKLLGEIRAKESLRIFEAQFTPPRVSALGDRDAGRLSPAVSFSRRVRVSLIGRGSLLADHHGLQGDQCHLRSLSRHLRQDRRQFRARKRCQPTQRAFGEPVHQ